MRTRYESGTMVGAARDTGLQRSCAPIVVRVVLLPTLLGQYRGVTCLVCPSCNSLLLRASILSRFIGDVEPQENKHAYTHMDIGGLAQGATEGRAEGWEEKASHGLFRGPCRPPRYSLQGLSVVQVLLTTPVVDKGTIFGCRPTHVGRHSSTLAKFTSATQQQNKPTRARFQQVASCGDDSNVRVCDLRSPSFFGVSHRLDGVHDGRPCHTVRWHPFDGNLLLSAGLDSTVKLHDLRRLASPLHVFRGHCPYALARCDSRIFDCDGWVGGGH